MAWFRFWSSSEDGLQRKFYWLGGDVSDQRKRALWNKWASQFTRPRGGVYEVDRLPADEHEWFVNFFANEESDKDFAQKMLAVLRGTGTVCGVCDSCRSRKMPRHKLWTLEFRKHYSPEQNGLLSEIEREVDEVVRGGSRKKRGDIRIGLKRTIQEEEERHEEEDSQFSSENKGG